MSRTWRRCYTTHSMCCVHACDHPATHCRKSSTCCSLVRLLSLSLSRLKHTPYPCGERGERSCGPDSGGGWCGSAPRGKLSREALWHELVRMFDMEETIVWLACCAMDPHCEGLDYAAFSTIMQAPSDTPDFAWVGTPHTPALRTPRRNQRARFSTVKVVPPPLSPQWLPKVFSHAADHHQKVTASHLASSLVRKPSARPSNLHESSYTRSVLSMSLWPCAIPSDGLG